MWSDLGTIQIAHEEHLIDFANDYCSCRGLCTRTETALQTNMYACKMWSGARGPLKNKEIALRFPSLLWLSSTVKHLEESTSWICEFNARIWQVFAKYSGRWLVNSSSSGRPTDFPVEDNNSSGARKCPVKNVLSENMIHLRSRNFSELGKRWQAAHEEGLLNIGIKFVYLCQLKDFPFFLDAWSSHLARFLCAFHTARNVTLLVKTE